MSSEVCVCKTCKKQVKYSKLQILCDECNLWYHGTCQPLDIKTWQFLGINNQSWFCSYCSRSMFPFWQIDDDELNYMLN